MTKLREFKRSYTKSTSEQFLVLRYSLFLSLGRNFRLVLFLMWKLGYFSLFLDYPENGYRKQPRNAVTYFYVPMHKASYPMIMKPSALSHIHIFMYCPAFKFL
jgi:hypothetical protein